MKQSLKLDTSKFEIIDPEKIKQSSLRINKAMEKVWRDYRRKNALSIKAAKNFIINN